MSRSDWAEILSYNGDVMLVNLDRIKCVFRSSGGKAELSFMDGTILPVGETYDTIFELLRDRDEH